MPDAIRILTLNAIKVCAAIAPWLAAMYMFYWLDSSGTWTSDTPHRGKLSVVILGTGMLLSFLVYSYFFRSKAERPASQEERAP